jgi:hypothetical protein
MVSDQRNNFQYIIWGSRYVPMSFYVRSSYVPTHSLIEIESLVGAAGMTIRQSFFKINQSNYSKY